jgi:hypothetical protein
MATLHAILSWVTDIAFLLLIPLVVWQTIEQRRLRRALQGMEAKEVVESARMITKMAPTMLTALNSVQRAWKRPEAAD